MSHSRDADRQQNRVSRTPIAVNQMLTVWRRHMRLSGVRQIERAIAELDAQLASDQTLIDRLVLAGQRRELRSARWLVNRLLWSSSEPEQPMSEQPMSESPEASRSLEPDRSQSIVAASDPLAGEGQSALTEPISGSMQSFQTVLFQATVSKLHRLQNLTHTVLEIDILKDAKKRELLNLVLQQLQATLAALRLSHITPDQLETKRSVILQDLWQATVTAFFGKYYTVQLENQSIEVVNVLLQDLEIVQTAILDKIPLFPEFLSHLLFQTRLTIDETEYAAGTVEAMARLEMLLQNVMLQAANAVIQPLLNRFSNVVAIKQTFYDKRLSSREIERFRNHLSWSYRTDRLFIEPAAIFESQYSLLILTENGIGKTAIYAPRNEELDQLSGIPFLVTLVLEIRDAIAPRIRAAVSFLGRGVVYVLTEIIGRGIGLIGRGMIKGIGNALQDTKSNRNSERWR